MQDMKGDENIMIASSPFVPTRIPHYYGDYVRVFFVTAAILAAFGIPVFGQVVPVGAFLQVLGIVALVLLAGLTNPHGVFVLWLDAIVSAIGVILLESAAISLYSIDQLGVFFGREIMVILLLLALYFSIKTLRAIAQHQLGHTESLGEFNEPEEEDEKGM